MSFGARIEIKSLTDAENIIQSSLHPISAKIIRNSYFIRMQSNCNIEIKKDIFSKMTFVYRIFNTVNKRFDNFILFYQNRGMMYKICSRWDVLRESNRFNRYNFWLNNSEITLSGLKYGN